MRRPNPPREIKFSGANGDRKNLIFPVQLIVSRIRNQTCLIHTEGAGYTHISTGFVSVVLCAFTMTCVMRTTISDFREVRCLGGWIAWKWNFEYI